MNDDSDYERWSSDSGLSLISSSSSSSGVFYQAHAIVVDGELTSDQLLDIKSSHQMVYDFFSERKRVESEVKREIEAFKLFQVDISLKLIKI
ncbi:MAG: hypothetical protein HAW66_03490 [Shewanella sp.]|nr:hypothetical protein [Shewanella sp.]